MNKLLDLSKQLVELTKKFVEVAEEYDKNIKLCNTLTKLELIKPGEMFRTTIGDFVVLDQQDQRTFVIARDILYESRYSDHSLNYEESDIYEQIARDICPAFEKEFGVLNIEKHTVDQITLDGQFLNSFSCKMRPITFDEARKYGDILHRYQVTKYTWTCTPWSSSKRNRPYSVVTLSPEGDICYSVYTATGGIRPVCYLNPEIYVLKI